MPGLAAAQPARAGRSAHRAARPTARQVFRRLAGLLDLLGLEGRLLLHRGRRPRLLRRNLLHAGRRRWRPRTARSGSTPACTGPTASKGRRRGTTSSIRRRGKMTRSTSAYERPAPHACFIQSVNDDLVNEGGIMDLWVREARIFKYGSRHRLQLLRPARRRRTALRRRQIVSGLMSFLKIGDRAAGAIKSGGTTRRAAKMVVLDLDHPDIEEFINWKVVEEQKVADLVTGSRLLNRHLNAILQGHASALAERRTRTLRPAAQQRRPAQGHRRSPRRPDSRATTSSACCSWPSRASPRCDVEEYDTDWNSKAYFTVSGQNSNNSVRIDNDFMEAVRDGRPLASLLANRKGKSQAAKAARPSRARRCRPATCGTRSPSPPGPAPIPACSSTPPSTNGTPAPSMGGSMRRTRARNTCFLDDTACNLASLNLLKFYDTATRPLRRRIVPPRHAGSGR